MPDTPTDLERRLAEQVRHLERGRFRAIDGKFYPAPWSISAALMRRAIEAVGEMRRVLESLDEFQRRFDEKTSGCGMPGNDLYLGQLMAIVGHARAALGRADGAAS